MEYLTEKEVADRYKVTIKTVQKWRRLGIGPRYHRVAKRTIRYSLADLADYDASNIVQTESPRQ